MSREEWRDIPGYGDHYQASTYGRIRVKDRVVTKPHRSGSVMKQFYKGRVLRSTRGDKWGHLSLHIGVGGRRFTVAVHKLVLLAFVGYPETGQECCHRNGIAWDNRPENLRWDTHAANNADRKAHGNYATGTKHPMAKFTDEQVAAIRSGAMGKQEAMQQFGVSHTHYYRLRKCGTQH